MMDLSTTTLARGLYRQLWRACPTPVTHKSAHTRMLRSKVREAFKETRTITDPVERELLLQRGENTLKFLRSAAHEKSTEQLIVQNLVNIAFYRAGYKERAPISQKLKPSEMALHEDAYAAFDRTVAALNECYQLALR